MSEHGQSALRWGLPILRQMATQPPAAPPARVCPHCASVGQTHGPECPWCGRTYRRGSILPAIAAMLTLAVVVIVGGLALVLSTVAATLEDTLDTEISRVQADIERQVSGVEDRVRDQVRRELDARLPPAP